VSIKFSAKAKILDTIFVGRHETDLIDFSNIVVNWAQSYWSAGSVFDITATFDAAVSSQ
jgi:hypothetical protein